MEADWVIRLDCRGKENAGKIQEVLRTIKPLSKCPDGKMVQLVKIEKLITVLSKNYYMYVRGVYPDFWANSDGVIWRAEVMDERTLKCKKMVFGMSMYEVLAKTAIYMYSVREQAGRKE